MPRAGPVNLDHFWNPGVQEGWTKLLVEGPAAQTRKETNGPPGIRRIVMDLAVHRMH
jgi:hypothetical protein